VSQQQGSDNRDDTLVEAFWSVARQLRRAAVDSLAQWDISPSQARALRVLAHHDGARLSELAEHLHIAARSATEVVDGLEAKGLVQRRADPQDRRATLVAPTSRGAELDAAVRTARGTRAERLFDQLSATDRAHLGRILRKLAAEPGGGSTAGTVHDTARSAAEGAL
jgi:DNA-binding MarR family transcriptional regulator